jgi:MFS family permease
VNKTFIIIAIVSFLNSLSFTILIPTIYPYALQLGLNDWQASLLLTTFSFAQFFATPVMGRLSDRYGRKAMLIISLTGTLISNIIAAFAVVAPVLFLARFLDGITGGNMSIIQAIVVDTTDKNNRAKGFGIMGATFGAGFVIGPVLAIVARKINMPFVSDLGRPFALSACLAGLALILTTIILKETLSHKNTSPINIHDFGFNRLIPSLFKPRLGRVLILSFLNGFAFTIFTFAFQPYFLRQLGGTVEQLALVFTLTGIINVVVQLFLGKITKKFGVVRSLYTSLFCRGVILLGASFVFDVRIFFVFVGFYSLFNIAMPLISTLVSLDSQEGDQGINAGLNSSYNSLANALGPAFAGFLITWGVQLPLWISTVLMIAISIYIYAEKKDLLKVD